MLNVFWFDANWKKFLLLMNVLIALIVLSITYVDIYRTEVSAIVELFRFFQIIIIGFSIYGVLKEKNVQEKLFLKVGQIILKNYRLAL